ncbi:hypothetical protein VTN02DRAFT_6674 [Thermoascus thermophilus]
MSLAAIVGKKILGETAKNHFGQEDPYFEEVPASRLGRAFGKKTQKRRKAVPPGISENDAKILTKVKRRAYRLDYALFSLCGVRFGWSSAIALIPVAGDALDAALALMVVQSCKDIDGGLPSHLWMMMVMNIALDFAVGLVPFVGDLADALYKCNTRNAILLEKHLRAKGAKALSGTHRQHPADPSLPEEFDRHDESSGPGGGPSRPQPAGARQENRGGGGWFGKQSEEDLETGVVRN